MSSVDIRIEIRRCSFSGITSYDRVWRKGAGKQGLECELSQDDRENVTPCTECLLSMNNIEICLTVA